MAEHHFDLQWFHVVPGNGLIGKSIGEAEIRKTTGASVVGILRSGGLMPNPDAGFRFQENDLVAIIGSGDALTGFQRLVEGSEKNAGAPSWS